MCASGESSTRSVQRLERRAVFSCIICVRQLKSVFPLSEDWKEEQFLATSCVCQLKSILALFKDWKEKQFLTTSCVHQVKSVLCLKTGKKSSSGSPKSGD